MAKNKNHAQEAALLQHLGNFSRSMVNNHHLDNLSEFVLHDICSEKGFDIRKSAYLVSNPDFHCLKGVAGFYQPESFGDSEHWGLQKDFTSHMLSSDFNQKVRSYSDVAHISNGQDVSSKKIEELVEYLELTDPAYHVWNSKHNNQGLFIFERPDHSLSNDYLLNFLHMLSFCPVF